MPTPREQLGQALKEARVEAGYLAQSSFAKKLHVSRPVITRAENPSHPVPSDPLLVAWAGATGADPKTLLEFARRAKSGTPEWFMPYRQAEATATTLRCWAPLIIPGLLQTEAYARAVLSTQSYTPERLAELVAARLERQEVLDRAHLYAVIDAPVLARCLGSPEAMAEQCEHLATIAERHNISLHVVPEGTNTGVWGGLNIAMRDGVATVCLSTGLDDVTTTASGQIDGALHAFERIIGSAMACPESLDFIRTWAKEWKERS